MAPGAPQVAVLAPPQISRPFTTPFVQPTLSPLQAFIGWHPQPAPIIAPFAAQAANHPLIHAFGASRETAPLHPTIFNSEIPPAVAMGTASHLTNAIEQLSHGNTREAGGLFRTDRLAIETSDATIDAQYALAALGEALWAADADATTYRALDRVHAWALAGNHHEVIAHERLARAALIRRTNGNPNAADLLLAANTRAMEMEGGALDEAKLAIPANRVIYIQSLMGQVDIQLQYAAQRNGEQRRDAYLQVAKLLADIDYFINEGRGLGADVQSERLIASQLYANAITQMMQPQQGYSMDARDLAIKLRELYPVTVAADEMFRAGSPIAPLLDEQGGRREIGNERHWGAALGQALAHARHSSGREFWAFAAGGAAAATFLGAAVGYTDTPTLMQFSSVGATLGTVVGKFRAGATAEEAVQALATGYSPLRTRDVVGIGVRRVAEVGLTYAAFGGAVPGVGALHDAPVIGNLVAQGDQLHGPGSAIAGLTGAVASQGHALGALVDNFGWGDGLRRWWDVFTGTTTFGSGTQAWMNADARFLDWLADNPLAGVGHRFAEPFSIGVGDLKLAAELGAGGWAAATLVKPELRSWAMARRPNLTRGLELAMLPGAWMLSTDIGLALGVAPRDAWVIPGLAFGFQLRDQVMSGLRPGAWDLANVLRAPAVEMTYAAVGGQMMQGAIPASSFGDIFGASMAIQVGLIPVGFIHALLLGFEQVRIWENKLLRSFSAETLGNFFRIAFGWSTWQGTLASMVCQTFVQCPWMTRVASEPVAGTAMRGAFRQAIAAPQNADQPSQPTTTPELMTAGATRLENMTRAAGTRWRFLTPIVATNATEALSPFLAFVLTMKGKDEPFETIPEERYFRMVWQFLTATEGKNVISPADAANFLRILGQIVADLTPGRRDARRGLLVATWAARDGVHGAAIRKFFADNDWLFDHYNIPREMGTPPGGSLRARMRQPRWFRAQLAEPR